MLGKRLPGKVPQHRNLSMSTGSISIEPASCGQNACVQHLTSDITIWHFLVWELHRHHPIWSGPGSPGLSRSMRPGCSWTECCLGFCMKHTLLTFAEVYLALSFFLTLCPQTHVSFTQRLVPPIEGYTIQRKSLEAHSPAYHARTECSLCLPPHPVRSERFPTQSKQNSSNENIPCGTLWQMPSLEASVHFKA